ncbi:MAG TPA: hypothetical protein VE287_07735 [Actinopolymorphaceae bacterium]|jgi:hypothetical protein|nr:hypothetical protein [Actinopolymorphaceae bacterium]
MNDHEMYELAKIRHADLIAERTRLASLRASSAGRTHRGRWPVGRRRFALVLHRLADRIEPTTRAPRKLAMPAQRHLHRA